MKIVIFSLVLLSTVLVAQAGTIPNEQLSKFREYHKQCLTKSGADEKFIDDTRRGEYPDDPAFKEYLFCLMKKVEFQNENGDFQKDMIVDKLKDVIKDDAQRKDYVEKCAVKKESPVESAYQYYICYHKNAPYQGYSFHDLIEGTPSKVKRFHFECLEESGVDQQIVINARKGQFSDDKSLLKYSLCMAKKCDFLDDKGKIQEKVAVEELRRLFKNEEKVQNLKNTCLIEKETPEETALNIVKCFHSNAGIDILQAPYVSDEQREKLISINNNCKKESGVSDEVLDMAKKGIFLEKDEFKSHIFCMYKNIGLQRESGEIYVPWFKEKMSDYLTESSLENLIEKCLVQKDTPQNTAYNLFTCIYNNSPVPANWFTLV